MTSEQAVNFCAIVRILYKMDVVSGEDDMSIVRIIKNHLWRLRG